MPVNITVIPTLTVSVSIISDPADAEVNDGESITFTATPVNGGENPVYDWFVNGELIPDIHAVSFNYIPDDGDIVYVTLTSSEPCAEPMPAESKKIEVTVLTAPDALTIVPLVKHIDCYGESTGGIELTVSGGSGNYTYEWNNGETTKDIYGLIAGKYTVTVTDQDDSQLSETSPWM